MSRSEVAKARELCTGCPVRRDCLTDALRRGESWGVWGGFTAAERKRMRDGYSTLRDILRDFDREVLEARVVRL